MRIEHSKWLHLKGDHYNCTRFYIQLSFKVLIKRNFVNSVYSTTERQTRVGETEKLQDRRFILWWGSWRVVRLSEMWCCVVRRVVPEFVRIIMSSSSTSWITWPSGQKKPRFFITSGTASPTAQYHIPNDLCLIMENTRYPLVNILFVVTEYRTITELSHWGVSWFSL